MISALRPYPAYKDSGVPWLGGVPEHWQVLPSRAIFEEAKQLNYPDEQMLSVTITRGIIPQQALLSDTSKKDSSNQDKTAYKLVRPGDIAYNKMRAWQGAVGASDYRGIVSPAYVVMRPRQGQLPRYFHHLFRTPGFAKEAERCSYGITSDQWSLRPEHFKMVYCAAPSFEEQSAIVAFLDHADRRIGKYIRAKQKLIKLLEEQRQAIINHAVTRGLDPNVRLKPSGVDWLGDIPEHWEVRRLKQLFREVDRRTSTGTEILLSLRMYRGLVPHNEVSGIPISSDALVGFKQVSPGQVVMNRMRASIGMFGVVPQHGLVSPDYAVLEPTSAVDQHYYVHLFKTRDMGMVFRTESKGLGTGSSGFMRLYTDRFGIVRIPVPRLSEQQSIVRSIAEATAENGSAAERVEREIALLREYRTRLIADVVTGKLDVREASANLPEIEDVECPEGLAEEEIDAGPDEPESDDNDE